MILRETYYDIGYVREDKMMPTWKWMGVLAMALLAAQLGCANDRSQGPAPAQEPPAAAVQAAPTPCPAPAATPAPSSQPSALKSVKDVRSYSLGVDTARNFKRLDMDIDLDLMLQGMKDVTAGNKLLVTDAVVRNVMVDLTGQARVKQAAARLNEAQENKKAGEEFLAANQQKEGVVTLPSGLQYKILKAGTGPIPAKDDTVAVKYSGALLDGNVFDSSEMAGRAAVLQVSDGRLIAGFREALRLMPVGSKWQLFIPSRLGYLDRGRGSLVGPNAALIYDVELMGIINEGGAATSEAPKSN